MDGIVVIDKPAGLTSHDVVSRVKKILGVRKAGHTGTLDPMATGVLPVCVGEATKLAQFLTLDNKTYRAMMLLGVRTDTQDIEGNVTHKSERFVSEGDIRQALESMIGKKKQVPPAYSAVKHKGKPLYKYARKGEFPQMPPREVEIFHMDIKDVLFPKVIFDVSCSKGTYIRTLCSDVGDILGCGACLSALRRLQSGFLTEDMTVSLDGHAGDIKETLLSKMLPLAQCLPTVAAVEIDDASEIRLKAGFQPDIAMIRSNIPAFLATGDVIKLIGPKGRLVAVAELVLAGHEMPMFPATSQGAKILRVFNNINEE